MALRNQPYLPLYVNDILTDEKLSLCSAETHGVYLRLLCLMHKSEAYGKIVLRKQFEDTLTGFSTILAKQMPFDFHTVKRSLSELIDEKVLSVVGDELIQKRMVKDNEISEVRAKSGSKGGRISVETKFAQAKPQAKVQANSEYEYANENEDVFVKYSIERCLEIALKDERWVKANKTNELELKMFNETLEIIGEFSKNPADYKRHFGYLKRKNPEAIRPQAKKLTVEDYKKMAEEFDKQNA